MAKYSRLRILAEISDTSDYAKAKLDQTEQTDTTATQHRYDDEVEVDTGGTAYGLTHLATCKWLKIHNPATNTYKVTAAIKTIANAGAAFSVDIDPGETLLIPDLYITGGAVQNVTITSTTASQKVKVSYEGT